MFFYLNLLFAFYSSAQKENNVWMLGQLLPNTNCGIDWNGGTPDTFSVLRDMDFFLLNASICDTSGALLFYTNGQYIANRNNDTLLNSVNFNPGYLTNYYAPYGMGLPQGAMIIPRPDHYGQYYVFHESGELCNVSGRIASQATHLSCTTVDMSLDNGLGGVLPNQKNIHVIEDTLIYGRLTGTRHANGRDWWVVAHRSDSDLYYKLLVTPDSIYGPLSQRIGEQDHFEQFTQQCTFSPDGSKYIIELTIDSAVTHNVIELLDFDRCTGDFSNCREIIIPNNARLLAPGCSFSPSSRFLYINNQIEIYQYDTWAAQINSSVQLVAQWDSFASPLLTKFYYQMIAPDDKIYISTSQGSNVLHYIESPDLLGLSCNVVQNSFFLPTLNITCMPNEPNFSLGALSGSICDSLTINILEEKNTNLILLYPIPARNNISIEFKDVKVNTYQIFNSIGQQIELLINNGGESMINVDISSLDDGLYSIVLLTDKGNVNRKFIKAK